MSVRFQFNRNQTPVTAITVTLLVAATTTHAQLRAPTNNASPTQLAPVVVTATRSPQSVVNLVSDIDSLSTTDLRSSGALSTADLLGTVSGVDLVSNGGPGSTTSLSLRGASNGQTLVLIDGFRVGSSSLGAPTYESLPFGFTDRIEVLRGPASGLYGADAIGGVIQLFTPNAKQGLSYGGDLALGSRGTRQVQAAVSGGSGPISAGLRLTRDKSDGFNATRPGAFGFNADDDGYEREGVLAHLAAQIGPGSTLRGVFLRNEVDTEFDNGAFEGARVKSRTELLGLTNDNALADGSVLTFKFGRSTDTSDTTSNFASRFETQQDQLRAAYTKPVAAGTEFQLSYERLDQEVTTESYAPVVSPTRETESYGAAITGRENQHILQLSFRIDKSDQYGEQKNGTFSYGYLLNEGLRLGGSYATGFRAPSFNDLYFPGFGRLSIKPETSKNIELGAYWDQRKQGSSQGWYGRAVVFQNRVRDLITFAPVCPDNDPQFAFGCADNVNQATIRGLGFSLGNQMGGFIWRLNADFLDPKDKTLGTQLPRRAKRQLTAKVEYKWTQFSLATSIRASGARFDDQLNTTRLGGFVTANLNAAYAFSSRVKVFANVINLADKDYSTAAGFNSQPRTIMAGVRFDSN
ncbi:MAG: TonB-dependent receptor [Burkholderiaceae bacterium]